MKFQTADPISLTLFLIVVITMISVVLRGAYGTSQQRFKRVGLFLLVWIVVFSAYVQSGFPAQHLIPGLPIFFGSILIGGLFFALSDLGAGFLGCPFWYFVFFQAFRFPLELILHWWAEQGTIPSTMTWTGQNFDIVTGLLALLVFFKPFRTKGYAIFFNVVGALLLVNVLRVVMMSSGLPFSWDVQPRFQLMMHLPYASVAFVLVFFAFTAHVLFVRKMLLTE